MKRNLATILALILIVSLLVPGMASAAATDTYTVQVTLTGPVGTVTNSIGTQAASASLNTVVWQLFSAKESDISATFAGTGLRNTLTDAKDARNSSNADDWSTWVNNYVTISDAAIKSIIADKSSTIWGLAQKSTNVTATLVGHADYSVNIKLTVDTQTYTPYVPDTSSGGSTSSSEPATTTTDSSTVSNPDGSTTTTSSETTEKTNSDGSTTATTTETSTTTGADGSKTESQSESETTTTTAADGSTTATTTATETATTTAADGTKTTTETKTEETATLDASGNGTVASTTTATEKDASGNVTQTTETERTGTVETAADGTKTTTATATTTVTDAAGNKETTVTEEKTVEKADGSTGTVVSDAAGNTLSAEATVSEDAVAAAAAADEAVTVPVTVQSADTAAEAAEVAITLPEVAAPVKVEIPVEDVTPGTVAVIVNPDGTEEIVKTSTTTEDGVVLTLEGSATVKFVENAKKFSDVESGAWYSDDVDWASSREVMNGMGDGTFAPNDDSSRGMVTQMLFNLDGAEPVATKAGFADVAANAWYADSVDWAYANGVAQGDGENFNPEDTIPRQQTAVMLYNYAKSKGYDVSAAGDLSAFTDTADIADWALPAMRWAVGIGLINGMGDGTVNPLGNTTRAQIAALTQRFCEKVA